MLYSGLEKNKLASIQIFFGKIDYKKKHNFIGCWTFPPS